jgi:hypothetical protein
VLTITFGQLKKKIMFEQNVGDGANLFVIIVAVIVGFAAAMGYVDFQKTKKEEGQHKD